MTVQVGFMYMYSNVWERFQRTTVHNMCLYNPTPWWYHGAGLEPTSHPIVCLTAFIIQLHGGTYHGAGLEPTSHPIVCLTV
jgi:hypothetical protein